MCRRLRHIRVFRARASRRGQTADHHHVTMGRPYRPIRQAHLPQPGCLRTGSLPLLPNDQSLKPPFQKAAGSVSPPVVPVSPTHPLKADDGTGRAHVNKLLEVLVEVRQIVPPLLVLGNQLLLALLQLQPLLLERLALDPLLVDARRHQGVLVGVGVLGVGGEKLVDGDEGEGLVGVAGV